MINKYAELIDKISTLIDSERMNDLSGSIILFLAYILTDPIEASVRGYKIDKEQLKINFYRFRDSYYFNYIFARYFLERIKNKPNDIDYAYAKYHKAITHLIKLDDYSTPLSILGTLAIRLIRHREINKALEVLNNTERLAENSRKLVLAEILGSASIEFTKLGFSSLGEELLRKAINIFVELGYKRDAIHYQANYLLNIARTQINNLKNYLMSLDPRDKFFITLYIVKEVQSRISDVYSNDMKNYIVEELIKSLSEAYWDVRETFLKYFSKTFSVFNNYFDSLISLARKFHDRTLETLVLIGELVNGRKAISDDDFVKLINFSYNLYKSGEYEHASDVLMSIITGPPYLKLNFKQIETLLEVLAFYLETVGHYEKIYYIFGEIAKKTLLSGQFEKTIHILESAGIFKDVSSLLRIKLLYEPSFRALIQNFKTIKSEFIRLLEDIKFRESYLSIGYLYSVIVEELLDVDCEDLAFEFIRDMMNFGVPAPYFLKIMDKLSNKGYYDLVMDLLKEISDIKAGNEDFLVELIKSIFASCSPEFGNKLLSIYRNQIDEAKMAKLLSELSIILLDKKKYQDSLRYMLNAIKLLYDYNAHLTILYSIASFVARCDFIDPILDLTQLLIDLLKLEV